MCVCVFVCEAPHTWSSIMTRLIIDNADVLVLGGPWVSFQIDDLSTSPAPRPDLLRSFTLSLEVKKNMFSAG